MLLSTFLPALSDEVFVNEYVMGSYVREVSLFSKKAKRWLYDLSSHLRCRSVLQDMLMQACACNQDGKTVVDLLAQQEHVTYLVDEPVPAVRAGAVAAGPGHAEAHRVGERGEGDEEQVPGVATAEEANGVLAVLAARGAVGVQKSGGGWGV